MQNKQTGPDRNGVSPAVTCRHPQTSPDLVRPRKTNYISTLIYNFTSLHTLPINITSMLGCWHSLSQTPWALQEVMSFESNWSWQVLQRLTPFSSPARLGHQLLSSRCTPRNCHEDTVPVYLPLCLPFVSFSFLRISQRLLDITCFILPVPYSFESRPFFLQ